ncbi:MAG TPA: hypothetical protein VGA20_11710 [Gemmatimonadales bacterium]
MMDDRFDGHLRDAARDYHRPPETPREEMWARIAAERERRRTEEAVIVLRPWLKWGLGIAALLAVGIGLGRWTAPGVPLAPIAVADSAPDEVAYRVAATQYLSRAETFLTEFRADVGQGQVDERFTRQAGDLLSTMRLMLDSPAARDPLVRSLLEDLELVLVQIALLRADPSDRAELDFITRGMEQRGVLTKLRTAIPAGPAATQAQGAL